MISVSTLIEQSNKLNLSGLKASLELQSNDANYSSLSFEERLYHLFEAEINQRENKRNQRMIAAAKFKDKTASLDQIEYLPQRKIDKSLILSLSNGDFINKNQNILITGATGCGKSFTMQAIARRIIDLGYHVK
jgi:DNA replication protein DnaC